MGHDTPLERHAASVAAFSAHRVASDAARVAGPVVTL